MSHDTTPTLYLTPRYSTDSQRLWQAAAARGWRVVRLIGWRLPEHETAAKYPVLYAEALMGPMLAESLGITLTGTPPDWLAGLPQEYLLRDVHMSTLGEARRGLEPRFVKPPNDKSFPARVYHPGELPMAFEDDEAVIVAEPVHWEVEFRCFVLDRRVCTWSLYAVNGELCEEGMEGEAAGADTGAMLALAQEVLADERVPLPRAIVLDVGYIRGRGWAVVETNGAWGAGIYGCDPDAVLDVLGHACVPLAES